MTEAALIEYQVNANIVPSDGYYGPTTQSHVKASPATNPAPTPTTPTQTTVLMRDLSLQSTGEDVRTLQKFLNKQGYIVSSSGAGSLGAETTFFGPATQAAVIKFQSANNINPAVGYVGPITRKLITSFGI